MASTRHCLDDCYCTRIFVPPSSAVIMGLIYSAQYCYFTYYCVYNYYLKTTIIALIASRQEMDVQCQLKAI